MNKFAESTLSLFYALPVQDKTKKNFPSSDFFEKALERGILFSPEVFAQYSEKDLERQILGKLGISGIEANSSFHKSWDKVRHAPYFQLVLEQIIHYYTTYGMEFFGVYDENNVYIPLERLNVPSDIRLELRVIRGYTLEEIKKKTMELIQLGVALKGETITHIVNILNVTKITNEEIASIRNREFLLVLYDSLNTIPEDPAEFLRYLVYKATGKTMLIKSKELITEIKANANKPEVIALFDSYKYGLENLASVFYRFKPIWLAFKVKKTSWLINKLRRLAMVYHVPVEPQFLDSLSNVAYNTENIKKAKQYLKKITIFRKLRILLALNYRVTGGNSIVYRIRNGKMYSTEINKPAKNDNLEFLFLVNESIITELSPKLAGKKIYIPAGIRYGIPTTEKQFVENIPSGTSIKVPEDLIVGIWWKDNNGRVDLDFSTIGVGGKFGWDGVYRGMANTVLFSGDCTSAPHGASELFYFSKNFTGAVLPMVNFYNSWMYQKSGDIPAKFFLAEERPAKNEFVHNYMVNPGNIILSLPFLMSDSQKLFGIVTKEDKGDLAFYFMEGDMGKKITSRKNKNTVTILDYLISYYKSMPSLNDLLKACGAILVETSEEAEINLAPENLERGTILNLFK